MTTEEAIKILEKEFDRSCGNYRYQNAHKIDLEDALWLAIAALRAQQEKTNQHPCINCGVGWGSANESGVTSCMETCEKLAAYMVQQERENPKPLMMEELREMDGDPVWVVCAPDADGETITLWALVSVDPENGEVFLLNSLGGRFAYGEIYADIKTIYRQKPKEG